MGTDLSSESEPHDCQEEDLIEVGAVGPDYWGTIKINTECEVCGKVWSSITTSIL